MKIFAIGWNYLDHNKELDHDDLPTEPTFFMKADTAIVKDNKPFFYPSFSQEIDYETEIVVRINKLGKSIEEKFAPRYYSEIGLGIDFTARDIQRQQRATGGPWEICKSFDQSAPISHFISVSQFVDIQNTEFHLTINGDIVQTGNTRDMIFNFNQIIAYLSQFFTLKTGDFIFTGTPANVGQVHIGDHLQGFIENNLMLDFWVK
jgi:2-keto-4-pentenoate hydratase/2-oxohepta-3-ene-1,7-dioic acid hydratase in catechol pathway